MQNTKKNMKKNRQDWKDELGEMVFSTNKNFQSKIETTEESSQKMLHPTKQLLEVKLEKKGRSGKTVCIICGFIGAKDDLKSLAKELKMKCGTGGSVKEDTIVIQGNRREKIITFLKDKGYRVKRVGG